MTESKSFWEKIFEVQQAAPTLAKTSKAHKHTYADLEEVWDAVKPLLKEHRILASFTFEHQPPGWVGVTILRDVDDPAVFAQWEVPIEFDPNMQAIGSAETYARRYGLLAALCLVVHGDDDDGQRAGGKRHGRQAQQPDEVMVSPEHRGEIFEAAKLRVSKLKDDGIVDVVPGDIVKSICKAMGFLDPRGNAATNLIPIKHFATVKAAISTWCPPEHPQEQTDEKFGEGSPQADQE